MRVAKKVVSAVVKASSASDANASFRGKTEFDTKVYELCRCIPKGKVSTYKAMAQAIGKPKAYRAVGSALRRNPHAPQVPCHRVVCSDLSLGGFFGSTDKNGEQLQRKRKMLEEEGVLFQEASSSVAQESVHQF